MDFYSFLSDFLQMCKIPIGSTVVLGTIKKWESTLTYLNMPARFFCHQGVFFCAACSCCSCRKHAQNPFIHFIVFQLFACWCLSLVFWVGCWEVFFYSLFIGDWREFCDQSYHWLGLCVVIIHIVIIGSTFQSLWRLLCFFFFHSSCTVSGQNVHRLEAVGSAVGNR